MSETRRVRGSSLLYKWRDSHGYSQWEAALKIGTQPSYISRWERGLSVPDVSSAADIEDGTAGAVPIRSWAEPEPADPVQTA